MGEIEEFIRGLTIDLSEKGLIAPEMEHITDDVGELTGSALRVSFEVVLFMDHNAVKYYMVTTGQKMQNLGRMTLKEAMAKYAKKKK